METINILVDGSLLSVSAAACFYCLQLSRRVRNLANADQGIGKGIADMAEAVERLNASLEQTRLAARGESETLQRQLSEARELTERTGQLLEEGDHQVGQLAKGLGQARQMVRTLEDLGDAASKRRARAGQPDWRDALADGMPNADLRETSLRPPRPGTERSSTAQRCNADGLPDAAALDRSEYADDPLPDVKPRRTRRTRRATPPPPHGKA